MMAAENFHGDDGRAALNAAGTELLQEQAREARLALIKYAAQAVSLFARVDDEQLKAALESPDENLSFGQYVLEDVIHGAESDEGIPICQTLLLVGDVAIGQEDDERLRVLVPIGSSALEALSMQDDASVSIQPNDKLPAEIYFEVFGEELETQRYCVAKGDVFEYASAADGGEAMVVGDLETDVWLERLSMRVDTRLPIVVRLHESIVNKRAVPQRMIMIQNGSAQPVDFD